MTTPRRRKRRAYVPPEARVNTRRWRALRDKVVSEEPLCRLRLPGCTIMSTTADHKWPRKTHPYLTYERKNLRGSCKSCNERRGDGNPRRMSDVHKSAPRPARALRFFG
jgi:5-methylcytosine-specific restriction endonuclease McrA